MIPSQENCHLALNALAVFRDTSLLTQDELVCLSIVREAIEAISRGEDLAPPVEGARLKLRLCRRVSVSYYHHLAPREREAPKPLPTIKGEEPKPVVHQSTLP